MRTIVGFVSRISSRVQQWNEGRARAREDEKYWNLALRDARVMADICRAMNTQHDGLED